MKKAFSEVFKNLVIEDEKLKDIIKYLSVINISAKDNYEYINVYVEAEVLIDKKSFVLLEEYLSKNLFKNRKISLKIFERFKLPSIYNPKNFYETYKDSIEYELKRYSNKYYILFINSKFIFEEKLIKIEIEDNTIYRMLEVDFIKILNKIFVERAGFSLDFKIFYIKEKKEELEKEINIESFYQKEEKESLKKVEDNKIVLKKEEIKEVKETKKQKLGKRDISAELIFGKNFEEDFISISEIISDMGEVCIMGDIIDVETRFLERTASTLFIVTLTDYTDSIVAKFFVRENELEDINENIKKGKSIKLKGLASIDKYDKELAIIGITGIKKKKDSIRIKREDTAKEKRVELHCHTKMSEHDGVSSDEDIIKSAFEFGFGAIAITDHASVQAFTNASHIIDKISKNADRDFKLIYGMEAYIVDDLKEFVTNPKNHTLEDTFVVFDIETTGLYAKKDKIIEIGAIKVKDKQVVDKFSYFINPQIPIPFKIQELTGISDYMLEDAPLIDEVLRKFLDFSKGCILVAHNAKFDTGFIREKAKELSLDFEASVIDTVEVARFLLPNLNRFKLDTVAKALKISLLNHHRAIDDALATANIWIEFIKMLEEKGVLTLSELSKLGSSSLDVIKKKRTNHAILLAKNDIGRINLYKLVSLSHIKYFNKVARIPKSILEQYREGILLGSACANGELFEAILEGKDENELEKIVSYYDYLEIQPSSNNLYMLNLEKYNLHTKEDIDNISRKIIELGKRYNKLVCATSDAHFINKEDEIYRKIILYGKAYQNAEANMPLYLRTTSEMIDEFDYLGKELAYEVVVKNTNEIAKKIEKIRPVRPDKCPPIIENSDVELREACYKKARKQYGKELPTLVKNRLEKELNSIINNGFAVMYIIAKKLVEKSLEDGYLVGSRGSVGSSFAAYTAGITEVNPLPAHYYCECKYVDFDSEEVRAFSGMAGVDMPDKECPICKRKLKKDGFDIPFETFLGFKGDKEPDIDLNFSGEYQAKAHAYTEEIFGKGHTFRAGTIGTMAFKTAYGFVKKYYEEKDITKRNAEIKRISNALEGIKRTTGQHPGGIIVLPHKEEIESFTPVQRPANDMSVDIITTHFDYHAIDHNLLKLDILGHMDPTMIKMLSDLTGIDPVKDIPLDSKETMSLFQNTSALLLKPEDIMGTPLGALGIPEFGTDFAMQMLIDAKPEGFSDLVRISGLSHGTDVWLGNAQTLIKDKLATIRTAICTRDDIMIYLISKGLDEVLAFNIMEAVRKGKGLKKEEEEIMREHDVPEWYIWSCNKIKYMFPKAHAAAYVMMAWRIAYCKIHYPIEYYTSFFTIRASAFSYELMCFGKEKLEYNYRLLLDKKTKQELTNKEADTLKDMRIVQEMYARGFEFEEIDIYKAKAQTFIITEDKKIMPSFYSIDGLGEIASKSIEEAASKGKFISKEDLMQRAKIGKSTLELLDKFNLLRNLPKSNQISIFDYLK